MAIASKRAGKTAHAFILDAVAQAVAQSEVDAAFHEVADRRWSRLLLTGKTVTWDDAKSYLEARAMRSQREAR